MASDAEYIERQWSAHWRRKCERLTRELAVALEERDRARDLAVSLLTELDQADVFSVIVGHGPRG